MKQTEAFAIDKLRASATVTPEKDAVKEGHLNDAGRAMGLSSSTKKKKMEGRMSLDYDDHVGDFFGEKKTAKKKKKDVDAEMEDEEEKVESASEPTKSMYSHGSSLRSMLDEGMAKVHAGGPGSGRHPYGKSQSTKMRGGRPVHQGLHDMLTKSGFNHKSTEMHNGERMSTYTHPKMGKFETFKNGDWSHSVKGTEKDAGAFDKSEVRDKLSSLKRGGK